MEFNIKRPLFLILISIFLLFAVFWGEQVLFNVNLLQIGGINIHKFLADLNPPYVLDPQHLADKQHVLFVDQNNPTCNNSYTRADIIHDDTDTKSWCDNGIFSGTKGILQPGDTVYFRTGTYDTYTHNLHVADSGTANAYITLKPYPEDSVTLSGSTKSGWSTYGTDSGDTSGNNKNTIYSLSMPGDTRPIKRNDYGISPVNTLAELINSPAVVSYGINFAKNSYDDFYYDSSAHLLYVKLASGTTNDIFFPGIVMLDEGDDGSVGYVEINGFNIQYGWDGIKTQYGYGAPEAPGIRIINNNISYIADNGFLGGGSGLVISGNTISYTGQPLKYSDAGNLVQNNLAHSLYIGTSPGIVARGEIMNNNLTKCWATCLNLDGNYLVYNNYIDTAEVDSAYGITDSTIYNNIILNNFTDYGATNIKFYNNLILSGANNHAEAPTYFQPASVVDFRNNIAFGPSYCQEINNINFSSSLIDSNIYSGCEYGWELYDNSRKDIYGYNPFNSYQTKIQSYNSSDEINSLFVPDAGLTPTSGIPTGLSNSSPAIGAGICLPEVTTDYNGNPRPTTTGCDIGPFQHTSIICGDKICNGSETCSSCPADCGVCSTDSTLKSLTVDGTSVSAFSPSTTSYEYEIPVSSPIPTVAATATNSNATVTVTQVPGIPGAATVLVTAQDGTTKSTYTVNIDFATAVPSSDATLKSLAVSSGALNPTFSPSVVSYTDDVLNSVDSITFTPAVNQTLATIKVNGATVASAASSASISLNVGNNTITIVVTAQDRTTTKTYTITATREAATTPPTSGGGGGGGGGGYSTPVEPQLTSEQIVSYVSGVLKQVSLFLLNNPQLFAQPVKGPANLQPNQPPPTKAQTTVSNNKQAIILVLQQLLKVVMGLLSIAGQPAS